MGTAASTSGLDAPPRAVPEVCHFAFLNVCCFVVSGLKLASETKGRESLGLKKGVKAIAEKDFQVAAVARTGEDMGSFSTSEFYLSLSQPSSLDWPPAPSSHLLE